MKPVTEASVRHSKLPWQPKAAYLRARRCQSGGEIIMICTVQARRLLALMAAVAAIATICSPETARSAETGASAQDSADPGSALDSRKPIDTVTIEGQREVKRQIDAFVYGILVTYMNDSLMRWDAPICPMIAGLPADQGEYIVARLSQVARDVHAPLAIPGKPCRPNLLVQVSDNPDAVAKHWAKHDYLMFNTCNGLGYVNDFLKSKRPVRVYYNGKFRPNDGEASPDIAAYSIIGLTLDLQFGPCTSGGGVAIGTRLRYGAVQDLESVIILVDGGRAASLKIGQLADYITMVGLAQIRADANTGTAPTILKVFDSPEAIAGLSPWDESFLRGLYTTKQSSVIQTTLIKTSMFQQLKH